MGLLSVVLLLGLHGAGEACRTCRALPARCWDSPADRHNPLHAHQHPFPRTRRWRGLLCDDDDTDGGSGPRDVAGYSVGTFTPADLHLLIASGKLGYPDCPASSPPLIYVFCTLLI